MFGMPKWRGPKNLLFLSLNIYFVSAREELSTMALVAGAGTRQLTECISPFSGRNPRLTNNKNNWQLFRKQKRDPLPLGTLFIISTG